MCLLPYSSVHQFHSEARTVPVNMQPNVYRMQGTIAGESSPNKCMARAVPAPAFCIPTSRVSAAPHRFGQSHDPAAQISRQVASDIDQQQQTDQQTARYLQSVALQSHSNRDDPKYRQVGDGVGLARCKVGEATQQLPRDDRKHDCQCEHRDGFGPVIFHILTYRGAEYQRHDDR